MADNATECGNVVCRSENYGMIREEMPKCEFNLFNSGAVRTDEAANNLANSKSWEGTYDFFCDTLGYDEDGVCPGDEDTDGCACESPSQKSMRAIKIQRNKCFSLEWCEEMCNRAPENGTQIITEGVMKQMMSFRQGAMVSTLVGLYSASLANDWGLIHDATDGKTVDPATGGWFDYCSFIDACGGTCCEGETNILLVHCNVFKDMVKCEQIQYIQPSRILGQSALSQPIPTYNGHVVVQHNRPELVDLTDPAKPCYTSICIQNGFFRLGNGQHPMPFATEDDPTANNCDGARSWYMREVFTLHPAGFSSCWTPPAAKEGKKPRKTIKNAELADPANWEICWDLDKIGVRFLNTYAGKISGKSAVVIEGVAEEKAAA